MSFDQEFQYDLELGSVKSQFSNNTTHGTKTIPISEISSRRETYANIPEEIKKISGIFHIKENILKII